MAPIRTLPLRSRIPPRIYNKDFACFSKIERHTTSFERDEETLDVDVRHEVVDGGLALSGRHRAVQHDGCDARAAQTPFDKLQHSGKLGKDYGFVGHVLGSELVEVVDERLNFGGTGPVLHLNTVDDGRLFDQLLILFDVGWYYCRRRKRI